MKELSLNEVLINGTLINKSSLYEHTTNSTQSLYNTLKTSFGPLGLDKMMINTVGDVTTTNDGATILSSLNVTDPFQKLVVNLSKQVDKEVGDGTTSVALLSALLVKEGNALKEKGLHQNFIVNGCKLAYREICNFIKNVQISIENKPENKQETKPESITKKIFENVIRTCLASKVANTEHLVDLLVKNYEKRTNFLKMKGSITDSVALNGFGLNCRRASERMPEQVQNAKIICIDFDLKKIRLPMNVLVTVNNPIELEKIKKKEESLILERVDKIIKSGVNVLLSTKGIDDLCVKRFEEGNVMAVKRVKYEDLEEIARLTNTIILRTMSDLEGNDMKLDDKEIGFGNNIGFSKKVNVEKMNDEEVIVIETEKFFTLLLKGSSGQLLDELERSMHDAVCVIQRLKENKYILPGGGAIECACYLLLKEFAASISSKECLAIDKYAEALLALPRLLASNAGFGDDLIAGVLKKQNEENNKKNDNFFYYGIDAENGTVQNNTENGIVEPSVIKLKSIRAATEAAISVIRIDEMIVLNEEKKEKVDECY
ncbi:chaperonin-containing T-complex alpha subunit Cct1 [Binucleata daphniae]